MHYSTLIGEFFWLLFLLSKGTASIFYFERSPLFVFGLQGNLPLIICVEIKCRERSSKDQGDVRFKGNIHSGGCQDG